MTVGPAIRVEGLSVRFGRATILDSIDLIIPTGSWFCVVGPNGAGKSTLLRAILGQTPGTGTVEVNGKSTLALSRRERAHQLALVPQEPVVPPGMPVLAYVMLGRTARLAPLTRESAADRAAAADALALLDLSHLAERTVDTLSGGERQRVVIARALAQQAPVLLLDEPTSALDIGHQQDLLDLVSELRPKLGLTVVSTMHDLTLAARCADTMVLLEQGRVGACGTPHEVLTTEILRLHYGAEVEVIDHRGHPVVVPLTKEQRHART